MSADAWDDWKRTCAAERCHEVHREYFYEFGRHRFNILAKVFREKDVEIDIADTPSAAWSELEKLALTEKEDRTTGTKNRYKDWFFKDMGEVLNNEWCEKRGFVLLRQSFRKSQAEKMKQDKVLARQRAQIDKTISYAAAWEDPLFMEEVEQLAKEALVSLSPLSRREEFVLLAEAQGFALDDPMVERTAGRKKSALFQCRKNLVTRVGAHIRSLYGESEDNGTMLRIGLVALKSLRSNLLDDFQTGTKFEGYFMKGEEDE